MLRPSHPPYLRFQARIYAAAGDPRRALAIYDKLLEKTPKAYPLHLERTRILCRFRVTKKCLAGAKKLLSMRVSAEAYVFEGQALVQKRRAARAIRSFRKAVALDPNHAYAQFMLGRTQYDEARFRKAISSLRRCLDLAEEGVPFWPDIHYFLGMAYGKVESKRLARKHLQAYLKTKGNPENQETAIQRKTASDALKRL
jgi:tetratricopeptide (TPR) repeat protein